MIRVRLEPAGVELGLPPGERLLDALDEAQHADSALPSSCRAANCGACLVHVLEGGTKLAAAGTRERALLQELGAADDQRLGCQIHAEQDAAGVVVLRVSSA
jgi:ferredoxin